MSEMRRTLTIQISDDEQAMLEAMAVGLAETQGGEWTPTRVVAHLLERLRDAGTRPGSWERRIFMALMPNGWLTKFEVDPDCKTRERPVARAG